MWTLIRLLLQGLHFLLFHIYLSMGYNINFTFQFQDIYSNFFRCLNFSDFYGNIWATPRQNQQHDPCAQRRLRSAWASSKTYQSSLSAWRHFWSSLCAQWVAEDPSFLHADSEESDQTGRMPRLIWVFAGRTCHFVGFVMGWFILKY